MLTTCFCPSLLRKTTDCGGRTAAFATQVSMMARVALSAMATQA